MAKSPEQDEPGSGAGGAHPPGDEAGPESAVIGPPDVGGPDADAHEHEPDLETEEPPPGSRSARLAWMLGIALVVVLGAGGAWLSWPLWSGSLPGVLRTALAPVMDAGRGAGIGERIEAVEARIGRIEAEIARLRAAAGTSGDGARAEAERGRLSDRIGALEAAAAAAVGPDVAGIAQLAARIDTLQAETAALKATQAERSAVSALAQRIDALDARLAALQSRPAGETGGDLTAALRRESDERLARLRLDNQALSAAVAALTRRLAALEEKPATPANEFGDGALLLAVGQLRDALRGSGGFARELDTVRAVGAADDAVRGAVEILAPQAAAGIPSRAVLSERFRQASVEIAQAALAPDGGGWLDQTLARLGRVVTVRRIGEEAAAAPGATGALARADARLAAGDLAGALEALKGLDGDARRAAEGWIALAERRLAAERALDALTARAIARIDAGRARSRGDAAGG